MINLYKRVFDEENIFDYYKLSKEMDQSLQNSFTRIKEYHLSNRARAKRMKTKSKRGHK